MKIYLAGPMRGYKDFNFPLFGRVTKELREQGHEVFNPAERDIKKHGDVFKSKKGEITDLPKEVKFSLRDALGADTAWICKYADAVYILPGWRKSKGALAERALGKALGLKIVYLK